VPRRPHRKLTLRLYSEYETDRNVLDWLDNQPESATRGGVNSLIVTLLSDALEKSDEPVRDEVRTREASDPRSPSKQPAEAIVVPETNKTSSADDTEMPSASLLQAGLFK